MIYKGHMENRLNYGSCGHMEDADNHNIMEQHIFKVAWEFVNTEPVT